MRGRFFGCLIFLLAPASAMAQVQVDVRLEKPGYLAGEPIVVLVDVRNVGDEPVGYSVCDGDVQLAVLGAERRVPPNIFGCFSFMSEGGSACGVDHPPLLQPGQATTFRYVLKRYDLRAGEHELRASGKAGVRWKYYPVYTPNLPPPPPKHNETDPVAGAQFDRTLSLNVAVSTEEELKAALAPLVSNADVADSALRTHARAAIIESAPSFLDSLIARFAEEDRFDRSAIDALGRIATEGSRTHLTNLFRTKGERFHSAIVLALARVGHRDDADFLANVLGDETVDRRSRGYAALGLGHIGGDQAVQHLERALPAAPPEVRPSIATALGNTRSRAAVPILIGMFGNNPARNEVCGALRTLTHRAWCDGSADDPAATRRQWLRWWNENGPNATIFGPDNCPTNPIAAARMPPHARAVEPTPAGSPRMSSLGSVPVALEITEVSELELTGISPSRPHPSQGVLLSTKSPARVGDYIQLTDARGMQWRIATGVSTYGISFTLPDEVGDGEVSLRVGRTEQGVERFSAPVRFVVTSGPLPLKPLAVALMKPVAPGQWTDLAKDHEIEFEVTRADRIEVEFRQRDIAVVTEATGPDRVHVQVPARLGPGSASVRTRTWIERTMSDWSAPASFRILERRVPPSITAIEASPVRSLVWWSGDAAPAFVQARAGEALVLRGHFPVARAADLRVQLQRTRAAFALSATDVDGGVRVDIPSDVPPGNWRLVIGTKDGLTSLQDVTTVRVM